MTPVSALVSFAFVAGMLTIIPGLDTALVLRSAMTRGRRHAFATALGVNTGVLLWGAGAALGVTALLTASQVAYTVLRYAGAAYLVWFGVTLVRRSPSGGAAEPGPAVTAASGGAYRAWLRGVATNLLNPKVGVFYVAMLPQFIPKGSPHLLMGLLLALVHNVEGLAWFTALIFGTTVARRRLSGERVHRLVDRMTGVVLVGFGLRLALSDH
ncbi:LysE family translocator [Microbispora corallina]|uniref:Lysine transporter LysE n=1 Tax=Microbispora corallina TaxID=83302 RepID=A0ABQ4G7N0_9ACTN|nr:LysE family translocator [Microbispora corallina]GIH43077.1 lysine transporter LysE [Microbispora corallina]